MKIIILGPPLSGKTTLAKYLRKSGIKNVLDFDDELIKLNKGQWPGEVEPLNTKLKNTVYKNVLNMDEVIFMSFEISEKNLDIAKKNGFRVFQLNLSREKLIERNKERLKIDPSNNAIKYLDSNISIQENIKNTGLVDAQIDASLETKYIWESILDNL